MDKPFTYDTNKYKAWKLPHPLLIHWILNPGLAFNEVILGQRVPKLTLIDKTSTAPMMERSYVPCPNCGAMNNSRLWAKGNAFGHWFGLICPKCDGRIPCLWNLTSLLILALTFPIWIPLKKIFEPKWEIWERAKLSKKIDAPPVTAKKVSWVKMGLGWGLIMALFFSFPLLHQRPFPWRHFAFIFFMFLIGGQAYGLAMWFFLGRRK